MHEIFDFEKSRRLKEAVGSSNTQGNRNELRRQMAPLNERPKKYVRKGPQKIGVYEFHIVQFLEPEPL